MKGKMNGNGTHPATVLVPIGKNGFCNFIFAFSTKIQYPHEKKEEKKIIYRERMNLRMNTQNLRPKVCLF